MKRLALLCGALCALAGGVRSARTHGAIPRPTGISFGPADGGVFYGTNFGGLWRAAPDAPITFLCEGLVGGSTSPVDHWQRLGDGRVVVAGTSGSALESGVHASTDASACAFVIVPDTADVHVLGLVADPLDDGSIIVAGWRATDGIILRGSLDGPMEALFTRAGARVTSVMVDEDNRVHAVIESDTGTSLARMDDGEARWDEHPQALAIGETLRLVGTSAGAATTSWLVRSAPTRDTLLRSTDGGMTLEPALEVEGRLEAFAVSPGGDRIWLQGPALGVIASFDEGRSFAPLEGSPHGSCLAHRAGRLYACGVPWRDGMAWGVSADGRTFVADVASFDEIARATPCPTVSGPSVSCADELAFLRVVYGFSAPTPPASPDADAEGDVTTDVHDAAHESSSAAPGDEGCRGAEPVSAATLVLLVVWATRRRGVTWPCT